MKNVIMLENHGEILNAHMHGEYPELALIIPAKKAESSETEGNISAKYDIGKYYPSKGIYAGELKKQNGFYGIFVALQDAGEKDEDGYSQKYNWKAAMKIEFSQDNIHVPDIRELSLIHLNIDDVNSGLSAAGGQKLEGWYWSSTEYSDNYAWYINVSSGSRDWYAKDTFNYVRPVLALKL